MLSTMPCRVVGSFCIDLLLSLHLNGAMVRDILPCFRTNVREMEHGDTPQRKNPGKSRPRALLSEISKPPSPQAMICLGLYMGKMKITNQNFASVYCIHNKQALAKNKIGGTKNEEHYKKCIVCCISNNYGYGNKHHAFL